MMKILIVEDEIEIMNLLDFYLLNEGYSTLKCTDGKSALQRIEKEKVDLVILDIMLPESNGFDVCRKIREKYFFPIIMLTAKSEAIDKIMGLTVGADDYITKPFNPLEVIARVKTQLRRCDQYNVVTEHKKDIQEIDIRGLIINKTTQKCSVFGKEIELTPLEFKVTWFLCENKGRVVASEELYEQVWGNRYLDNNNTLMAHIARIRDKMGEVPRKPKFIKTVWGIGYTIE
ncbi:MAG: VanR-ABDEGLN family response regulator transcription factor [Eubacterium sp.]